jgi:phenylalanyl-tRNA synthetase beta chain
MLVSWNWLKQYVDLGMTQAELEDRFSMSGLNHEGTRPVGDDLAIELEVPSNRPDCLGHIGVAREVSVLYDQPLKLPAADPASGSDSAADYVQLRLEAQQLCPHYTARIIRGVKVQASPAWLVDLLATIFRPINHDWAPVNNIVDITNYVLMEVGQPLHAFDLAKVQGGQVIVREAQAEETFVAIDHNEYTLAAGMCVIGDTNRAIALGGVMGGADSEVSSQTSDLLIEAARFDPLATRTTARALGLHSPSSFRFERGVDPLGVDWASRRCCQLILEIAGGEMAEGIVEAGAAGQSSEPVVLRLAQLERILGIHIPADEVARILTTLGCLIQESNSESIELTAPSWRGDLSREIDLVEDLARVHGYDKIPEDVGVPMASSQRTDRDRVQDRLRQALVSAGFDEAITASMVPADWPGEFMAWTERQPIRSNTPMLKGADTLRTSLVPSLLEARRVNQSLANPLIELFETASIYLPSDDQLPRQQWTLALASGQGYFAVKGLLESLLAALKISQETELKPVDLPLLDISRSAELWLDGERLGLLGDVCQAGCDTFSLRGETTILELNIELLARLAELVPQHKPTSAYPSISRDLNVIVAESVRWSQLQQLVAATSGDQLEHLLYRETYRDVERDGENTKRILFTIVLRSDEGTMTGQQADELRDAAVAQIEQQLEGRLLAT